MAKVSHGTIWQVLHSGNLERTRGADLAEKRRPDGKNPPMVPHGRLPTRETMGELGWNL